VLRVATGKKLGTERRKFIIIIVIIICLYHDFSRNITQQLIKTNWPTK